MKTEAIIETIQADLFSMQDLAYRDFHSKLMPTVEKASVIGVRTPQLRKYSRNLWKTQPKAVLLFLKNLPHTYYEENNLHAFCIEQITDYEACIRALDEFLPYVDNWATCDMLKPKIFKTHTELLLKEVKRWLGAEDTYTVRFAIGVLMNFYLDDAFLPQYPQMVAAVHSEEYYINMMIAWYFATALAKQYPKILPYLEENRLEVWVHNKTIQKALESYRITPEQKVQLRLLKRK